jgi:hypothetical protein
MGCMNGIVLESKLAANILISSPLCFAPLLLRISASALRGLLRPLFYIAQVVLKFWFGTSSFVQLDLAHILLPVFS